HEERRAEDDEERRGGHDLARPARGEQPEEGIEAVAPDEDHGGERPDRGPGRGQGVDERAVLGQGAGGGEQRQERENRRDGEVLKEQDREGSLPVGGLQVAALLEDLQGDRGGRKRERDPDRYGGAHPE